MPSILSKLEKLSKRERCYVAKYLCLIVSPDGARIAMRLNNATTVENVIDYFKLHTDSIGKEYRLHIDDYECPLPPNMHIKDLTKQSHLIFRILRSSELESINIESIREIYINTSVPNLKNFFKTIDNIPSKIFSACFKLKVEINEVKKDIILLWNRFSLNEYHWTVINRYVKLEKDIIEYVSDEYFDTANIIYKDPRCLVSPLHYRLIFDPALRIIETDIP